MDAPVRLSSTKASIASVTGEKPLAVEKARALRRLKNKMEYLLINGTAAAGDTGTARGMAGIDAFITSNVTARASGTSFTEQELNDIIQQSWDAVGNSYVADLIVAPVVIKRRIASFGTNLTRTIPAADKRLTNEVRVYDSEVGQTVKVIAHKDVRSAAGTLTVLAIREDLSQMAFLTGGNEPHWEEFSKTGYSVKGAYVTEFTYVDLNEKANVKRTGYSTGL
ncbi:MAG: hypothetical protein KatS3mg101_0952 [Patescibacteria group bacterium]|nr:MAG: hypothetical protein KatS3mg101_0952 [Patescibacteria group bacterium]